MNIYLSPRSVSISLIPGRLGHVEYLSTRVLVKLKTELWRTAKTNSTKYKPDMGNRFQETLLRIRWTSILKKIRVIFRLSYRSHFHYKKTIHLSIWLRSKKKLIFFSSVKISFLWKTRNLMFSWAIPKALRSKFVIQFSHDGYKQKGRDDFREKK